MTRNKQIFYVFTTGFAYKESLISAQAKSRILNLLYDHLYENYEMQIFIFEQFIDLSTDEIIKNLQKQAGFSKIKDKIEWTPNNKDDIIDVHIINNLLTVKNISEYSEIIDNMDENIICFKNNFILIDGAGILNLSLKNIFKFSYFQYPLTQDIMNNYTLFGKALYWPLWRKHIDDEIIMINDNSSGSHSVELEIINKELFGRF
jgi:hypothetical protein